MALLKNYKNLVKNFKIKSFFKINLSLKVIKKLNKNIQARYFWQHVLSLDATEKKLKDDINKKLIFGITKEL